MRKAFIFIIIIEALFPEFCFSCPSSQGPADDLVIVANLLEELLVKTNTWMFG